MKKLTYYQQTILSALKRGNTLRAGVVLPLKKGGRSVIGKFVMSDGVNPNLDYAVKIGSIGAMVQVGAVKLEDRDDGYRYVVLAK